MGGALHRRQTHRSIIGAEPIVERHAQKEGVQGGGHVAVGCRDFPFVGQVLRSDVRTGQAVVIVFFTVETDAPDMLIT